MVVARISSTILLVSAPIEEGLCSTTSTGCEFCGVEFNGRITVQDHIFTAQHINQIKERGAIIRGNGSEDAGENRPSRTQNIPGRQRSEDDVHSGITAEDLHFNPLNLVYNTLLDPNIIGTPITMLQIPESVMTQISNALRGGKPSIKFTQDGLDLANLSGKVDDEDFKNCAKQTESEVGDRRHPNVKTQVFLGRVGLSPVFKCIPTRILLEESSKVHLYWM